MSLIISAPHSGSGKTTITLGLLRALHRRGMAVRGAKSGPDYIDPQFHAAACAKPCFNLDAWAMTPSQIKQLAGTADTLIVEGAMGLFDGAPPDGSGATADLARILSLPVVLVVDASAMAQSIAPLVAGFARHDQDVQIAGVILNRVGSDRHAKMLRASLAKIGVRVFGHVPRSAELARPSRHLGLVQAGEMPDLEDFLNAAADVMERCIDLEALLAAGQDIALAPPDETRKQKRTIAIARDAAFSFFYAHQEARLKASGTELRYFSPLRDEPVPAADHVFLPGGYPELYAQTLSNNSTFISSLRTTAKSTPIYGECGGYMVLGEVLTDADGNDHEMAGLLPLHTSFAKRKLHLGYRTLTEISSGKTDIKAHEFHYASTLRADGTPLYTAKDAEGNELGHYGLIEGHVSGSFAHLIS